jgi:hypothetical protein
MNPWQKYVGILHDETIQLGDIPGGAIPVPKQRDLVGTIDALVHANQHCRQSVDAAIRLWIEPIFPG